MTDVALRDVPLSELEAKWGVTRNTIKNRAKALSVEILNPTPRSAYWPGDFVDLGDQLHEWIQSGNELATFWGCQQSKQADSKQSPGSQLAKRASSQLAETTQSEVIAISDPFAAAEALRKAVASGDWFTTDEMAQILGKPRSHVAGWDDGKEVRPGSFIEKRKLGNDVFWRAVSESKQPAETPQSLATDSSEISRIHPGERMLAAIDVSYRDVTGSGIFSTNTIR